MSLTLAAALLASALAASGQAAARLLADQAAPTVRLTGDEVTVPLVLVKGYPFLEGAVNGVKGKFMFDIGSDAAITLNHHRIPLPNGIAMPGSKVGSGQIMPAQLNKTIASVSFAQFSYTDVHNVQSNDASQIERHITPDYLGWVGFEFFRGYAIKLDYRKDQVTFYRDGPAAPTHFLKDETVVAVIPFVQRKLARISLVEATIGKTMFDGSFDTGAYGNVWITQAMRRKLAAEGVLADARGAGADGRVDITGVDVGSGAADLSLRFDVLPPPYPPAEAIGERPENQVTFAYNLFSKYKTVIDYPNHNIYLLKYGGR